MPKQTLILDSTQIDAFLTCPQLWKYGQKDRLTPATGLPTGEAMNMGTLGHKFLELYYKAKAKNKTQMQGIEAAEGFKPDEETCLECGKGQDSPHLINGYDNLQGEDLIVLHHFKPKPYPLGKPERAAVLQRFREYTYTHSNNDIIPLSPAHVEVGFSHLLYEDDDVIFILEGRMDLIGMIGGQKLWMDHKFQLRARNLYKKSIQFRNYSLVAWETMGINMGLINYVRLTKGVTKDTFHRDVTCFSAPELMDWKKKLIEIYKEILISIECGYYEQNWSACSGKFGYPCDFTPLCEESHTSILEAKKTSLYSIREEWKPW